MTTTSTTSTTSPPAGTTNTQGLADWAAPYITDYLSKAQALANTDYQVYQGPFTAEASPLQSQAFAGIGALTVPQEYAQASGMMSDIAQKAGNLSYSPTSISSTYKAPAAYQAANVGNMYSSTAPYNATAFQNLYKAPEDYKAGEFSQYQFERPEDYQAIARSFTDQGMSERYMNPYIQQALEPTLKEIQRQSAINMQPQLAKLTQAGGYGGSREALLRGEAQRNLLDQVAKTTGEGYSTAYDRAAAQFNAEEARRIQEAQYAATQGATFAELKSRYGLAAAQAAEQSKQFSAQQKATAADLMARYGLSAQQATEQSKQFSAQQALENARNMAQYGLEGKRLSEQSRQFGATQAAAAEAERARLAMEAAKASELSRQFGAEFGLKGLEKQLSAAKGIADLGSLEQTANMQNIAKMLEAGATQRDIEQAGLKADYDEFIRQQEFPYKQAQYMRDMISGLPISSVSNNPASLSGLAQLIAASGGVDELLRATGDTSLTGLLDKLFGGNLGTSSGTTGNTGSEG